MCGPCTTWVVRSLFFSENNSLFPIFLFNRKIRTFFLLLLCSVPYLNTRSHPCEQHDAWREDPHIGNGSSRLTSKRIKSLTNLFSMAINQFITIDCKNWDIWDDISIWRWCCVEDWVVIHVSSLGFYHRTAIMSNQIPMIGWHLSFFHIVSRRSLLLIPSRHNF